MIDLTWSATWTRRQASERSSESSCSRRWTPKAPLTSRSSTCSTGPVTTTSRIHVSRQSNVSSARRLHPSSPNRKQSDIAIRRSEILTKLCLLKRRRNKIYKSSSFYQINRINRIDSLCCSNSIWIRVMQGLFFYVWNKIMKVKPWKNLKCYPNIIITETFCESS